MTEFEPDVLSSQVEKIIASSEFKGGKRLKQFLQYVIQQSLDDRPDNLQQYTIAIEALGYPDTFDPQSNPSVRVLAKRLRRALDLYYADEGRQDPVRIKLPKGSYVPVFSLNQIVLSKNDSRDVSETRSPEFKTLHGDEIYPGVAVVLFRCLNGDNDLDYIASGITEEIIISLTRFSEFRVVGPLFRKMLGEKSFDLHKIRETYKTRFMLDGTVSRREHSLHITVKLTDTQSGRHIWADTIDCDVSVSNLFSCQEHIVTSVTSTIGDNFGIINTVISKDLLPNKTPNPSSYEAILRFYHYIMVLNEQAYIDALSALEQVVEKNGESALCTAALGDLLITGYFAGYDESDPLLHRVEELGRKAVALEPNCQQARFTMAMVHFSKFQKEQFLTEASRVIKINPNNANLIAALAMHYWMAGERGQGRTLMEKAISFHPHHPGWYFIVRFCDNYRNGDFASALYDAQNMNSPGIYIDPLVRAATHGQLGHGDAGKSAIKDLLSIIPDFKHIGRDIMKRLFYLDEHIEMLWDGLKKAGI